MGSPKRAGAVAVCLLVVASTAGVGFVDPASAQADDGPIRIDSCGTIADDGRYVLTGNVTNTAENVCIEILSSDVILDGGGHVVDAGPNATAGPNGTGSVGVQVTNSLTTIANVTVRDVTVTDWTTGVAYIDANDGTVRDVNASANARHGIRLVGSSDTRLVNVTAVDNDRWSLYAAGNATNTAATNLTTRSATVSFTASNVAVTGVTNPPLGTENRTNVGQFVGAAATGPNASLRLVVPYTNQTVTRANITEDTLRLWAYDGTWDRVPDPNAVNTSRNRVVAAASPTNASVLAPLGETETPTPTPTPTATASPTPTATATPTATPTADTTIATPPQGTTGSDETNGTGGAGATDTSPGGDSGAFGPGFGVGLAVAALLAVAVLALRRR